MNVGGSERNYSHLCAYVSVNVDNQRARLVAKDILETAAHLSQLLDGLLAMPGKRKNNTTAVRAEFNPTSSTQLRGSFSLEVQKLTPSRLTPFPAGQQLVRSGSTRIGPRMPPD